MWTLFAGIILQPKFNMSINEADLYLCDGNIYNRIYSASGSNVNEAIKYSKVARVEMTPLPLYANNTFAANANLSKYYGVTPENRVQTIDKAKPYWDPAYNYSGVEGLRYAQEWNATTGQAKYLSYQSLTGNQHLGTYAMTDLKLSFFNISHGSYATRYPKQYWRAMNGPYFPVQVFDKAHGGYPDHKYNYHPNYSPIANLFSGIGSALSDPTQLLSAVSFGGNITINVFSMNITLDMHSDAVSTLMSTLTETALDYIYDGVSKAFDITGGRQDPEYAYWYDTVRMSKYYDDPSIPRLMSQPLNSEMYTDLSIDFSSFLETIFILGLETRNDQTFSPAMKGLSWDGYVHEMQDSRYMGTNINPWIRDEYGYRHMLPGYKPGLLEFGGDNIEHFYKDPYYETFKQVCQNWAETSGELYNPFFESENMSTWHQDELGKVLFDKIEDPRNWALRWYENKPENPGPCRTPTMSGIFPVALYPTIDLGLLSACGNLWYEEAPTSGKKLWRISSNWVYIFE